MIDARYLVLANFANEFEGIVSHCEKLAGEKDAHQCALCDLHTSLVALLPAILAEAETKRAAKIAAEQAALETEAERVSQPYTTHGDLHPESAPVNG